MRRPCGGGRWFGAAAAELAAAARARGDLTATAAAYHRGRRLPGTQCVVLSLRDRGGCRIEDVSRIVAVSPTRARALLHQARATLHHAIADHLAAVAVRLRSGPRAGSAG